jgi:hypothetical protein
VPAPESRHLRRGAGTGLLATGGIEHGGTRVPRRHSSMRRGTNRSGTPNRGRGPVRFETSTLVSAPTPRTGAPSSPKCRAAMQYAAARRPVSQINRPII